MRFSRVREEETRLGITPLIDIIFLLLIFLMLTSRSNQAGGLSVSLPHATEASASETRKQERITIDKSGSLYHNGTPISKKGLPILLGEIGRFGSSASLVLEADRETHHGDVVELMDLARTSGIRSVVIATLNRTRVQR